MKGRNYIFPNTGEDDAYSETVAFKFEFIVCYIILVSIMAREKGVSDIQP
jgi:hypothetical protein